MAALRDPELSGVAVVFVGSFNPLIFQPAWFAAQGLIRSEEAVNADVRIVHAEVVSFSGEAVSVDVQRDRLSVGSTLATEAPEIVRDLAISTLSILSHTPIRALGLNFYAHFPVRERTNFDTLGWTLAPREPWGTTLNRPGLRSLTIEALRPDEFQGHVRVTVEPSAQVKPHGVYIAVNDHFALADVEDAVVGADDAVETLKSRWNASRELAGQLQEQLLALI